MLTTIILSVSCFLLLTAFILKQRKNTATEKNPAATTSKNINVLYQIYAKTGYEHIVCSEYALPFSSASFFKILGVKKHISPKCKSKAYLIITKSGIDIIYIINTKQNIYRALCSNKLNKWIFYNNKFNRFECPNPYVYAEKNIIPYIKQIAKHSPSIRENINVYALFEGQNNIENTNVVYNSVLALQKTIANKYQNNLSQAHIRKLIELIR